MTPSGRLPGEVQRPSRFPLCPQKHAFFPRDWRLGSPAGPGRPEASGRVSVSQSRVPCAGLARWHLVLEASEFWRRRGALCSGGECTGPWKPEDPDSDSDATALAPVMSPLQTWTCLSVERGPWVAGYCGEHTGHCECPSSSLGSWGAGGPFQWIWLHSCPVRPEWLVMLSPGRHRGGDQHSCWRAATFPWTAVQRLRGCSPLSRVLLQDGVLSAPDPEPHAGACGTVRLAAVPWTPAHRGWTARVIHTVISLSLSLLKLL